MNRLAKNGAGDGDRTRDIQLGKLRSDGCRNMKEVCEPAQKSGHNKEYTLPALFYIHVLIHENHGDFVDLFVDVLFSSPSRLCTCSAR